MCFYTKCSEGLASQVIWSNSTVLSNYPKAPPFVVSLTNCTCPSPNVSHKGVGNLTPLIGKCSIAYVFLSATTVLQLLRRWQLPSLRPAEISFYRTRSVPVITIFILSNFSQLKTRCPKEWLTRAVPTSSEDGSTNLLSPTLINWTRLSLFVVNRFRSRELLRFRGHLFSLAQQR